MKKQYQLICMSFDGEYKTEAPLFDEIKQAWDYANDIGSKWFFYPFCFVTNARKTIVDSPDVLCFFNGVRIKTVSKIFKAESLKPETKGLDAYGYALAMASINRNNFEQI